MLSHIATFYRTGIKSQEVKDIYETCAQLRTLGVTCSISVCYVLLTANASMHVQHQVHSSALH